MRVMLEGICMLALWCRIGKLVEGVVQVVLRCVTVDGRAQALDSL